MNYQDIITIEPGKRGGRPIVRGMRIAVADVLGWQPECLMKKSSAIILN